MPKKLQLNIGRYRHKAKVMIEDAVVSVSESMHLPKSNVYRKCKFRSERRKLAKRIEEFRYMDEMEILKLFETYFKHELDKLFQEAAKSKKVK